MLILETKKYRIAMISHFKVGLRMQNTKYYCSTVMASGMTVVAVFVFLADGTPFEELLGASRYVLRRSPFIILLLRFHIQ